MIENHSSRPRYDYLYTKPEIIVLSRQIQKVQESAQESYAVTNNHFREQAVVNALEILETIEGTRPAVPPLPAEAYPDRFR